MSPARQSTLDRHRRAGEQLRLPNGRFATMKQVLRAMPAALAKTKPMIHGRTGLVRGLLRIPAPPRVSKRYVDGKGNRYVDSVWLTGWGDQHRLVRTDDKWQGIMNMNGTLWSDGTRVRSDASGRLIIPKKHKEFVHLWY